MTTRSPLHGYNTNYRRQGVVYHVQTEDLGDSIGAIVTQVFTGGTILGKKRTEYKDIQDADDLEDQLRARMQSQHKVMLIAVRDDTLETVGDAVAGLSGDDVPEKAPEAPRKKKSSDKMRDTIQMRLPPEFLEEIDDDSFDDALIIDDFPPPETPQPPQQKPKPKAVPPTATPIPQNAPMPQIRVTPPPFPVGGVSPVSDEQKTEAEAAPASIAEAASAAQAEPAEPKQPEPKQPEPKQPEPRPAEPKQDEPKQASEGSGAMPPPVPADAREPRKAPNGDRPEPRKPAPAPAAATTPERQRPRIFSEIARPTPGMGEEQLGERSLDEVILSYLADDLSDD